MFYSKYSDYAPDQIITEKYEEVSEMLLNMVEDGQTKEKMKRNII